MGIKYTLILALLFFTACGQSRENHIIAKIPEASGICFHKNSKTLYAVSDRGTVYELNTKGKILRKKHIGDYDLEGIACDPRNGTILAIAEGKDNILVLNPKTLNIQKEISIQRSFKNKKLLVKDKENGIEGITVDNRGIIYVSNQSTRKYPKEDPSVLVLVKDLRDKETAILSFIDHGKKDIAGLAWQNGYLYMVSDQKDKLYRYSLDKKKVDLSVKLPKFAQEGVTFDEDGNIYFANDKGNILKYKAKKFNLH